jgi:hypothetical protein
MMSQSTCHLCITLSIHRSENKNSNAKNRVSSGSLGGIYKKDGDLSISIKFIKKVY